MTKPAIPTTEELLLTDLDSKSKNDRAIAAHVREIIRLVSEDPEREGLRKTPERYEKALKFLTSGYHQNVDQVLNGATFSVTYDEMVVVKDIEFFSLCEHHLLPFFGKAHVAYLPSNKVVGLSKIARLVNMFARRLQIQERMTSQIAKAIRGKNRAPRCRRHHRSPPPVHADARRGKATRLGGNQRHARRLSRKQRNPRRIPCPDPSKTFLTQPATRAYSLLRARARRTRSRLPQLLLLHQQRVRPLVWS